MQNEEIISGLENLLRKKKNELFEEKLTPMSLEQFNREIDQSISDSENGRISSATDLKKKARNNKCI